MAAPGQTPQRSEAVAELQRVLATYAKITGLTAANPGSADGIVGTKTILAVAAVLPHVPGLPTEIRVIATLAPLAIAVEDARNKAAEIITKNASTISKAIVGMAVYQAATGKTPTQGTAPVQASGPTVLTLTPIQTGAGAGVPTIYFFDRRLGRYRVAVYRGLGSLGAAYVEVAPQASPPPGGIPVSKSAFLVKTGRWYSTPLAIAGFAAAGAAAIGGAALAVRRRR